MSEARDLKLTAWICLAMNGAKDLRELSVKTSGLEQVVNTFVANARHMLRLARFTEAVYAEGKRFQLAESVALRDVTGDPFRDMNNRPLPQGVPELRDKILDGIADFRIVSWDVGPDEIVLAARQHDMFEVLELLMYNQITSAWTVFETLYGDLWEAAVNAHPRNLSELKGQKDSGGNKTEKEKPDAGKQIPIWILQKHDYNVRSIMGTVLRTLKKVTFQRFEEVQESYRVAFGDAGINAALDHKSNLAINAVRNLIVHRASICDDEYKRQQNGASDILPKLEIGEKLLLDGEIVSELVRPALQNCIKLIHLVDNYLASH